MNTRFHIVGTLGVFLCGLAATGVAAQVPPARHADAHPPIHVRAQRRQRNIPAGTYGRNAGTGTVVNRTTANPLVPGAGIRPEKLWKLRDALNYLQNARQELATAPNRTDLPNAGMTAETSRAMGLIEAAISGVQAAIAADNPTPEARHRGEGVAPGTRTGPRHEPRTGAAPPRVNPVGAPPAKPPIKP